jgi:hypothetical protein
MDPTSGKQSGHGYGGSIREAGGSLGALGAAREEMYFREQDEKKLKELGEKHQNKSNNYSSQKTNETK